MTLDSTGGLFKDFLKKQPELALRIMLRDSKDPQEQYEIAEELQGRFPLQLGTLLDLAFHSNMYRLVIILRIYNEHILSNRNGKDRRKIKRKIYELMKHVNSEDLVTAAYTHPRLRIQVARVLLFRLRESEQLSERYLQEIIKIFPPRVSRILQQAINNIKAMNNQT